MANLERDPEYMVVCKCSNTISTRLNVINTFSEDWGRTLEIQVAPHRCEPFNYPVLDVEEYYKDEGDDLNDN